MRPFRESVTCVEGESWAFLDRRLAADIPFEWHCHPEFELTLTLNSEGHRYVGDAVGEYGDGDLVLIGPGVPHSWHSDRMVDGGGPHVVLVSWFTPQWSESLTGLIPEFHALSRLLARAGTGVAFSQGPREAARPLILEMRNATPARRTLLLLEVLQIVSGDRDAVELGGGDVDIALVPDGDGRLSRVLEHLHAHFAEPTSLAELADLACVSVSALQRMFRRQVRTTIVEYVVRLRIGRACSMLIHGSSAVSNVAADVGYGNMSLFNRHFLRLKGMRPTEFRKAHRLAV